MIASAGHPLQQHRYDINGIVQVSKFKLSGLFIRLV
jgi:hypothetical protein